MSNLNALIAQGGRGIKSPVERYLETKAQTERSQMNSLAMQSTQQQMGINQQSEQRAQQQHMAKLIAPYAKSAYENYDDDEKVRAVTSELQGVLSENNVPVQDTEYVKPQKEKLKAMAEAGGLAIDEKVSPYAKIDPSKYTPESLKAFARTKNYGDLTPIGKDDDESSPFAKINPNKYTPESIGLFEQSGFHSDLEAKPEAGATGTSEFERLLYNDLLAGRITSKEANKKRAKRIGVLAGTDMRITDKTRFEEQTRKTGVKETRELRGEFQEGVEHFKNMSMTIDEAMTAMDSGNTGLADTMLNQVMSQVQDDNVRAYAMYQQFDKPFGTIANRVAESIERFLGGKRSDEEKAEIRSTLQYFKDSYAQPKRQAMRDRYRALATESGHDPFSVVPPVDKFDIRDSTLIDNKRKKELLKLHFPNEFK